MATKKQKMVFTLRYSQVGVLFAVLLFGLSLFPSLLPRAGWTQGLLSGISIAIGYGIGTFLQWLWNFLELPKARGSIRHGIQGASVGLIALIVVGAIWQFVGWQNEVREVFGYQPIGPSMFLRLVPTMLLIALLLIIIARSIWKLFSVMRIYTLRRVPRRVSIVLGVVGAYVVIDLIVSGVLVAGFFAASNQLFSIQDSRIEPDIIQPISSLKSGSVESNSSWETLGRQGRKFVSTGPSQDDINQFSGGGALEPIRVYAGLRSADTLDERADLALDELIRTNAFDRDVLVVATTTGTGWLDPQAVDPLEYVNNGDTAIVGVQYSYLPSAISLLADQQIVKDTSQAVFSAVHDYWSTLPEDDRPEFYVYGLSLGSFGVESVLNSVNIINEPINGALLAGPPFVNPMHNSITGQRDEGSPAWQPIYDNGNTVRFTSRENALNQPTGEWGETKIIYSQHSSDPVVFYSPSLLFDEPEWLKPGQRGPDITDSMIWIPIVTMWQVAVDMPAAGAMPEGYAHNYSKAENVDNWSALFEPEGWTESVASDLKQFLNEKYR